MNPYIFAAVVAGGIILAIISFKVAVGAFLAALALESFFEFKKRL